MLGINLNKPIEYCHSSLRFFNKGEHHIERYSHDDVLLMVYEGVLRFSENGEQREIYSGQYYIQKHNSFHNGELASDEPKYLYVHFHAEWAEDGLSLPFSGTFEYTVMRSLIEEMDRLSHSGAPYIIQSATFFRILSRLYESQPEDTVAVRIAEYIDRECTAKLSLDELCSEFHFSKNHVINVFRKRYGVTPIIYRNQRRLLKAEHLMEVTSNPLEDIALQCGFRNYSHFYKMFIRKHNCSPEKWRMNKRIGGSAMNYMLPCNLAELDANGSL